MQRFILASLASSLVLAAAGAPARAQNIYPYQQPQYGPGYQTQLSPYLNMLRGGDPAANYFLGVLPEFQRRENRNEFRSQIQGLQVLTSPLRQNPLAGLDEGDIPRGMSASGHPTAFSYTGTYFGGPAQGLGMMGGRRPSAQQQQRGYKPLGPSR
jgi:hypothetical protein